MVNFVEQSTFHAGHDNSISHKPWSLSQFDSIPAPKALIFLDQIWVQATGDGHSTRSSSG